MHYKNGREAKNGDKVLWFREYGCPIVGVICNVQDNQSYCNAEFVPLDPNRIYLDTGDCLHLDDVREALDRIPQYPIVKEQTKLT